MASGRGTICGARTSCLPACPTIRKAWQTATLHSPILRPEMAHAPCSICGSTEGPDHICPGQNAQLVGQTLNNKYAIDEILGQGGMGMVFLARNIDLNQAVAVKTLHPSLAAAPQFYERFRREAQLAA